MILYLSLNLSWLFKLSFETPYTSQSNFLNLEFPKHSKNLEVNFIENKDNFSEDEWKSLYKLSENTFVEETDSLKKNAAGAGLTDND